MSRLTFDPAQRRRCGLRIDEALSNPDGCFCCASLSGERRVESCRDWSASASRLVAAVGVLRDEGLSPPREGKQIYYRIDSPQALAVMQVLYQQFCAQSQGETTC